MIKERCCCGYVVSVLKQIELSTFFSLNYLWPYDKETKACTQNALKISGIWKGGF